MRITFKNVGQGDSIIIEWEKNKEKRIGIIDCNKYQNTNPVLDHIKNSVYNINAIDFLILSHPHLDHFSGFEELIRHCINSGIIIKYFLHTVNNTPAYWKSAVNTNEAKNAIRLLLETIQEAEDKIGMNHHPVQANTIFTDIKLNEEYFIKFLAPTNEHLNNYIRSLPDKDFYEASDNNSMANWLSTVIKIYSKKHDNYILFTSDSNKDVLFVNKKKQGEFKGNLVLCQCPHHGSEASFKKSFWQLINRNINTPIVFSVGKNTYGHPSVSVVKNLIDCNYQIFSTNQHGYFSNSDFENSIIAKSVHLSIFSSINPTNKSDCLNGDKIFELNSAGIINSLIN